MLLTSLPSASSWSSLADESLFAFILRRFCFLPFFFFLTTESSEYESSDFFFFSRFLFLLLQHAQYTPFAKGKKITYNSSKNNYTAIC